MKTLQESLAMLVVVSQLKNADPLHCLIQQMLAMDDINREDISFRQHY